MKQTTRVETVFFSFFLELAAAFQFHKEEIKTVLHQRIKIAFFYQNVNRKLFSHFC